VNIVGEMKELFVQISDEKALQWLNAVTPKPVYDFNKDRRLEGTCEWIFRTEKYKSWMDGAGCRDLWIVGIPGKDTPLLTCIPVNLYMKGPESQY
jgi:hypothetical protein